MCTLWNVFIDQLFYLVHQTGVNFLSIVKTYNDILIGHNFLYTRKYNLKIIATLQKPKDGEKEGLDMYNADKVVSLMNNQYIDYCEGTNFYYLCNEQIATKNSTHEIDF